MKTPKNNHSPFNLRRSNSRWKWMAGATSAAAAGVAASQASATTITLVNNYIGASEGNHLNADLTGDGHPDLTMTGAKYFFSTHVAGGSRSFQFTGTNASAQVILNGVLARASHTDNPHNYARLGSQASNGTSTPVYLSGSIFVFFKDLHINGGAPTIGSLEVSVSAGTDVIQLDSLTYNGPVQSSRLGLAVSDGGSSLGLLALGAGGILALRRSRNKSPV